MMKQTFAIFFLSAFFCFVLLIAGCSGGRAKPKDLPPLYPCTLTFTQEGVPLADASIILHSDSKWSVGGKTDEKGEVRLATNGFYEGVPEGTYKITVWKMVVEHHAETSEVIRQTDVVERKFSSEATTPLEITIGKGNNNQTFDVGKAVSVNIPISD